MIVEKKLHKFIIYAKFCTTIIIIVTTFTTRTVSVQARKYDELGKMSFENLEQENEYSLFFSIFYIYYSCEYDAFLKFYTRVFTLFYIFLQSVEWSLKRTHNFFNI